MRPIGILQGIALIALAAYCNAAAPRVKETQMNIYDFRWLDDKVALVLTRESKVFRSNDTGFTWFDITGLLESSSSSKPSFLYPNPVDPNKIYIRGSSTSVSWISEDKGVSWTVVVPNRSYRNLMWHSKNSDWVIGGVSVGFNSPGDVYLSTDFCRTWTHIADQVFQYSWGDAGISSVPSTRAYYIRQTADFRDFVYSDDSGKSFHIIHEDSYTFLFREKQVFSAIFDSLNNEVLLKVSPDVGKGSKTWYITEFPFGDELDNNGYAILDDSTGAVYMGVNHQDYSSHWGNVYVSDSIGYRYVLSSAHIRLHYDSSYYPNYDFDKINGVDGIYMANVLMNWDEVDNSESTADEVQSFITFNNGGSWKQLVPPTNDINGQPYQCTGPCYLHLHGWTSYSDDTAQFGPFYSINNAIGLVIGSGNVGEYLSFERDQVTTFLSRDAGLDWKEIYGGPSIYEFGDDGSILVLAPFGEATTTLYYSLDEGTTSMTSFTFTSSAIDIDNIFTEPTATATTFVMMGTRNGQTYLISVDFSAMYSRNCTTSDYELWQPTEGTTQVGGLNCQLGRQVTYQRRKPSADCFNEAVDHIIDQKSCNCTEDDWECDFGYERGSNGSCVLVITAPTYPPENCEGTYYKTKGYRKEAGNMCILGVDHSPAGPYDCSDSGSSSDVDLGSNNGWIAAVVILPLLVLILVGAFLAIKSEKLREKIPFLEKLHSWKDGYLKVGNVPGESVVDEEYIVGPLDDQGPDLEFNSDPHASRGHFQGQSAKQQDLGIDLMSHITTSSADIDFDPRK